MNRSYRRLRRALAFAALGLLLAVPASHAQYPRLALYGSVLGSGYPLWDSTGTLDLAVCDQVARYDEVILDIGPITPYRPDALAALRQRHPGISLLAYVTGHDIWTSNQPDSSVHFPTRYNHMIRRMNGFLYDKAGRYFPGSDVNLAKRDIAGRYVVAESLAVLFNDAILKSGQWDGIFIDVYCNSIAWMVSPAESIDYQRAGYATFAAFDAAWKVGTDTLADRLRQLGGSSTVLVGNCAAGTKYIPFNGWMRENFPLQGGGTWYTNMFNDPGGYFPDEGHFRAPTHNYIFSALNGTDPYYWNNTRKVRYGLGTAALGSGFHVFGPSNRYPKPFHYHSWWYDEYAVDLTTGMAAPDVSHIGWLGQPLAPYYQMIWIGTAPDAVTNTGFETDVTTGWTVFTVLGSLASRDVVGAPVGAAAAHITVPTAGAVPWSTAFATTGSIPLYAGSTYSATFWARSDRVRSITVVAAKLTSGEYTSRSLNIGPTWKQYQVALVTPSSGTSKLAFYVGGEAGDVWFDDCHFQAGSTTIFRRDFQNGAVLVNPSNAPLMVQMERSFRKITGIADPAVNNGQTVTQVTVNASDALFLIGSDQIPPATITDLHGHP